MRNTADVTGGKPIAVVLQSISGVSAINPLVAFYDIHGGKREVLFFSFVPDTTRDRHEGFFIDRVITEKHFSVSIAPVRSRDGSLMKEKKWKEYYKTLYRTIKIPQIILIVIIINFRLIKVIIGLMITHKENGL
jgi:hypothetical protein